MEEEESGWNERGEGIEFEREKGEREKAQKEELVKEETERRAICTWRHFISTHRELND